MESVHVHGRKWKRSSNISINQLYFMDHIRVLVSETENCKLFPLYSITNL